MTLSIDRQTEWLETDGRGGFASGTSASVRTRRYHALLMTATTPPTGRVILVNGFDAWVETPHGSFPLTTQHYAPDHDSPDGMRQIESFTNDPWPTWIYRLPDGTVIQHDLFVPHGLSVLALRWQVIEHPHSQVRLIVRPFFSVRDYHSLHHENPSFRFEPVQQGSLCRWLPYPDVPGIAAESNGQYRHDPLWYRQFSYSEKKARGLDYLEDLAAPGEWSWQLKPGMEATLIFAAGDSASLDYATLNKHELARRSAFATPLHRAADAYIVQRGQGKTIIAGYPWFTDWGRDTFIALRGLCLATKRYDDARNILLSWAGCVSEGMLPNRFPDNGEALEYNSVDASLWYIIAIRDYFQAVRPTAQERATLLQAVEQILTGYSKGTRHGIRMDQDGLLAAGESGVQLTWMDAKVGDWVVTPRIGKPVEVNALWLNALWFVGQFNPRWLQHFERGMRSFSDRYWNEQKQCLYDVIDVKHQSGQVDGSLRPNQILAVGGLPLPIITGERARKIVATVEEHLLTPLGLRSLAPNDPHYVPRYEGGVLERDGGYHQGTVWPWLIGPFVEAWVRVHGNTEEARKMARQKYLSPLMEHLKCAGLGHISEIADAQPPHQPRGCPFQAWSLSELIRLDQLALTETTTP
ncbi:MAG TPA: amylo-alpha-1,6-glucosidase [Gemmatales bacterium]|nr:amylo-alpha-1,6-glucosidase [Gemmatales bacterium]